MTLGGNNLYMTSLFPPRECLVSDIPAGEGNIEKLLYGEGHRRMIFLPIRALRRPTTRTMNMSRVSYRDSTSSITPMVSCTFIQIVFAINYTEFIAIYDWGIKESLEIRTACHLFIFVLFLANYFRQRTRSTLCVLFSTFSCRHPIPWFKRLIRKEIKFSSYIRKSRKERFQSHIFAPSSYMTLQPLPYFLIHAKNFLFFFISD